MAGRKRASAERECHRPFLSTSKLIPFPSGSIPITDDTGRVVGAICGGPADPTWAESCVEAVKLIAEARTQLHTTRDNWNHRRGWFLAMAHGVSYGKGQKVCNCCYHIIARTT